MDNNYIHIYKSKFVATFSRKQHQISSADLILIIIYSIYLY